MESTNDFGEVVEVGLSLGLGSLKTIEAVIGFAAGISGHRCRDESTKLIE